MAEPESTNTMLQNSFIKNGDGNYSLRTAGGGGGSSVVQIDPTANTVKLDPANNVVTIGAATAATSGPVAESGFGGGPRSVTGPAADAVITNNFPAAAGELHKIEVIAWFSAGTPAAADNYNIAFKFGGTVISPIPIPAALNVPVRSTFYFNSAAGTPFGVHAIGAGTAAVTYNAFLTATRLVG